MYDGDNITRYNFGETDYGGGADERHIIRGPLGKVGFLHDYGCYDVTELMAGATTLPSIQVGTLADADHYGAAFAYGALTIAGGGASVRTRYHPGTAEFAAQFVERVLPANTAVYVTCVMATGAGLNGKAKTFVDIIWSN